MKLKWHQAPVKTQWGHDMVVADVAIDKDHTVSLYCEREQTAKVEAMFAQSAQRHVEHCLWARNGNQPCPHVQPAQQQELEELTAQRDQLADILTRTANALKGQPAELSLHSWHDLPEVAQQLRAAQQQEPVAYVYEREVDGFGLRKDVKFLKPVEVGADLYTSPPQDALVSALYSKINYLRGKIELLESGLVQAKRTWQGLTEEDIEAAMPGGIYDCLADPWDCGVGDGDYMRSIKNDVVRIVRAIEAKLKAKNSL